MAIKITEECINCGACEPECPNNAIYEGGVEWSISDGTTVKGSYTLVDGTVVDADQRMPPVAVDTYYITPNYAHSKNRFRYGVSLFSPTTLPPFLYTSHRERSNRPGKQLRTEALHGNPGILCIY